MKYIRTKDGRIYKIFKEDISLVEKNDGYACYGKNTVDFMTAIYIPKPVEKVADTIEELVEFVAVKFKWEELPSVHSLKELYKKAEEKGWDKNQVFDNHKFLIERNEKDKTHSVEYIKYAIATDKGLIYVAKMNDKGELELL